MFQANETDARNREAMLQFGPKASGNFALHYFRVDAKVGEDAPSYDALNYGKSH